MTGSPAVTVVYVPLAGAVVGLEAVPDPVFSAGMVGPGMAIDPFRAPQEACAPLDGKVVKLHPHAYAVVGAAGRGVLVHLGIDTVELNGAGFELLAAEGTDVCAGQPMVRWDPAAVEAAGRSPICPVVALDALSESDDPLAYTVTSGDVRTGDELFRWL